MNLIYQAQDAVAEFCALYNELSDYIITEAIYEQLVNY
jgi:hypothetical protein